MSSNPFADYLNDIERYEAVYKSPGAAKTRYCIPDGFSMSKNLMSFNLGFPTGFLPGSSDKSEDDQFIQDWIGQLDSELDFVMITEHLSRVPGLAAEEAVLGGQRYALQLLQHFIVRTQSQP